MSVSMFSTIIDVAVLLLIYIHCVNETKCKLIKWPPF